MEQLLLAALDAAYEKKVLLLFSFGFETWLGATLQALAFGDLLHLDIG